MKKYEKQDCSELRALIEEDKVPYAVLYRIIGDGVGTVITDHKRIVITCSGTNFYPLWVWTAKDVTKEELNQIYEVLKTEFAPLSDYRINTRQDIAEYLIKRINEDGGGFKALVNINSYECPVPKKPKEKVDGKGGRLAKDEVELAARLTREASQAISGLVVSEEDSIKRAKEGLEQQNLFVWRNSEGKAVSFCAKRFESDEYIAVSECYTVEEERGKRYAGWLINQVCEEIIKEEKTPILYADADYVSSNRCYQNIGFVLNSTLVTIGK